MCMTGIGRLGFSRVLVELNAEKQLKDVIEVAYKKKDASISMTKFVQVEYAWKPSKCSHCCVFSHEEKTWRMIPKDKNEGKQNDEQCDNNDGFKEVQYRKNRNEAGSNNNRRNDQTGQNGYTRGNGYPNRKECYKQSFNKKEYRTKRNGEVGTKIGMEKSNEASIPKEKESSSKVVTRNKVNNMPASSKNSQYKNKEDILGSNSFALLNSLVDEEDVRPKNEERKQVDEVLGNNGDPTVEEWESWTEDMKRYYRDKKELLCAAGIIEKEEDIDQDLSETGESLTRNEIEGVSSHTLN
ncbi:zinc knuckle CX2CX4HX4C [Artemisia annua]|uniref:Zinc knuckle CX2CX4HX4C n=1 Tax=Artemisia annua TaxID=35608 RepID=A0A2U1QDB6_ARTAN|nr:zinc knuckle CX2CX4HX4C [Artemisia annua]